MISFDDADLILLFFDPFFFFLGINVVGIAHVNHDAGSNK